MYLTNVEKLCFNRKAFVWESKSFINSVHNFSLEESRLPKVTTSGTIKKNVSPVFPKFDASNVLLVDQVGCHRVFGRVVPRAEDLFAEKQPPGGVALLSPLFFGVLFALKIQIVLFCIFWEKICEKASSSSNT